MNTHFHVPLKNTTNSKRKIVRVEISEEVLVRLLTQGQVCAADLRCLDCRSKQFLWRICLDCCLKKKSSTMGNASTPDSFYRIRESCLSFQKIQKKSEY
jgi:hypothetical protein